MSAFSIFYVGFDGSTPSSALATARQHLIAFASRILFVVDLALKTFPRSETRQLLEREGSRLWNFALLLACWRVQLEPDWSVISREVETLTRHVSPKLRPYYRGLDHLAPLLSPFLKIVYNSQDENDLSSASKDFRKMMMLMGSAGAIMLSVLFDSEDYQATTAKLASIFDEPESRQTAARYLRSIGWSEPEIAKIIK